MLTTVASFTEPWEAHLFAGRLKAEGLMPSIVHEQHIWNNWPIATALRGVKVQVPQEQADAANAIFQASREGTYADLISEEFGPEPDSLKCPVCGSREVRTRHSPSAILLSFASFFVGTPMPAPQKGRRCKACCAKWDGEAGGS